jgi:hypothetical protein
MDAPLTGRIVSITFITGTHRCGSSPSPRIGPKTAPGFRCVWLIKTVSFRINPRLDDEPTKSAGNENGQHQGTCPSPTLHFLGFLCCPARAMLGKFGSIFAHSRGPGEEDAPLMCRAHPEEGMGITGKQ